MYRKKFVGEKGITDSRTRYEYREISDNPQNPPNVVYIVMDDLGFSQLHCYGSTIDTPNLDKLAEEGLRYNNFHTTAICSATRASLLTGMNHHTAGISNLVEFTTGCENGAGHVHRDCATIAEILKEYGYGTYATGKWHLANLPETTEAGPFDNWPLGKGFDRFYGFMHGEMDQFHPRLVQDNSQVAQPKSEQEGYHFSEDITDKAISYIYHQRKAYPEKPFFLYLAYGAMHTPHHAPKSYIDKYKGAFDEGWDKLREVWFNNQKELGILPEGTKLSERNELVPPWDSLTDAAKKVYARYMEAFAGMLTHTDEQIGRLLDYLEKEGIKDDTVIVFISDNGASAEGGAKGTINSFADCADHTMKGAKEDAEYVLSRYDEIGTYKAFNHYNTGWASLGNVPFTWYKTWTYSGGVNDPMIIRYPKLIKDGGAVRNQYHHVSDITPTMLDVIGVEKPEFIKGVKQKDFSGISFKYTFEDGAAPDRKHVQYFEIMGNRAIYKDGWKAVTNHATHTVNGVVEDDVWELYHVAEDFSETKNVAAQFPEKVKELDREFYIQAARADVFPITSGYEMGQGKANVVKAWHDEQRFGKFTNIIEPFSLIRSFYTDLTIKSHEVKAVINRDEKSLQGVLFSVGNIHGGFSFYVINNKLKYSFNYGSKECYQFESSEELPLGEIEVSYRFKVHKNSTVTLYLYVNGELSAKGEIDKLLPFVDFIATVGGNLYSSVVPDDYQVPFDFNGQFNEIEINVDGHFNDENEDLAGFFAAE